MIESLWQKTIHAKSMSLLGIARALILWPLSLVYRIGFSISKLFAPQKLQLQIPIITVGGLTVGGAGKTPFVALLAEQLQSQGKKIGIVSSGYRRSSSQSILAKGAELVSMPIGETGDEPRELAEKFPNIVFAIDKSKPIAARALAESKAVDLIIVDDGFQTRGLKANLSIVLIDSNSSAADYRLLPAGRLRESFSVLNRADVVVISKLNSLNSDPSNQIKASIENVFNGPTFKSAIDLNLKNVFSPESEGQEEGSSENGPLSPVMLISALANNADFKASAMRLGIEICSTIEFPDHFHYDSQSVEAISNQANAVGAKAIVTSEKDWTKLRNFNWNIPVWFITVQAQISEPEKFTEVINKI